MVIRRLPQSFITIEIIISDTFEECYENLKRIYIASKFTKLLKVGRQVNQHNNFGISFSFSEDRCCLKKF